MNVLARELPAAVARNLGGGDFLFERDLCNVHRDCSSPVAQIAG